MEKSESDRRKRILVGEDSLESQKLIRAYLQTLPVDLVMVADGRSLLETAQSEDFDLLLVDASMPVMSGEEAVVRLRAQGFTKPVISVSASSTPDEIERFRKAGFTAALSKPFEREIFIGMVSETLRLKSSSTTVTPDTYEVLRSAFFEDLPKKHTEIEGAAKGRDYSQVKYLAHKTRAASMFGFKKIGDICARIEAAAGEEDEASLARLLEELGKSIEDTKLS